MKLSPHGNIAIITGSADGIGEAVALLLARNKFKVAIVDLDKNKAETAAIRLREETGANVIAVALMCQIKSLQKGLTKQS